MNIAPKYTIAPNGVFWTIQGEGHLRGFQMAFLRLAGCSVGCPGCDTDYSASEKLDLTELLSRITAVRRNFPRALGRWALDSGAFTEIKLHGKWSVSPRAYADDVRRFRDEIGGMDWAAIQDWMCEPPMLARTGLTVADHQRLTVQSYADLLHTAPEIPWIPVLQGWQKDDYLNRARQRV